MPVINAFRARSPQSGILSPALSADLHEFAGIVGWPAGASITGHLAVKPRTPAFPVAAAGGVRTGFKARSFSDDYYHRIHIKPRTIAMGNVASVQTTSVTVWNAYLVAKTVTAVDGELEGIVLTAPGPLPLLLQPLSENTWLIAVTLDGPAQVDTDVVWHITGLASLAVHLTATRIIAFPFVPDWADGIREMLAWATDILRSTTGAEQRRQIRLAPRRSFEISAYVEGRERMLFDLMCAAWSGRIWAMPIWHDIQSLSADVALGAMQILCTTQNRDFVGGGLAMLRGESATDYEVVQIDSVAADRLLLRREINRAWPSGSRLYPVRQAVMPTQPEMTRLTDQLSRVALQFRCAEPCDWTAIAPATLYRGRPVLETPPEESEDLTSAYQRLMQELDNGTGMPIVTDTANLPFFVQGHRWLLGSRTEAGAHRALLYWLAGRQRSLWLPTFADDLELVSTVGAGAQTMDVANVGYARFGAGLPGRMDVRIELVGGTVLHRRIASASEIDANTERLLLDSAIAGGITLAQVQRISFMVLARCDSDEIEIQHETDGDGVTLCQMVFKGVRDDEF